MNCSKIYSDKEFNIIVNEYFNLDYVYVYILQHMHPNKSFYSDIIIKESPELAVIFKTNSDGYYGLITLMIPIDPENYYYYKNGKFYKNIEEVELREIMETNPHISNVISIYDYYFLTARLRKCYVNACLNIFEKKDKCYTFNNKNNEEIYKRDLIWSALNVIEYLAEFGQYEEALRLLEELTDCNGICYNNNNNNLLCSCHHG